jgi:ABC-type multidrug transport system fused ATPase/permease subunit
LFNYSVKENILYGDDKASNSDILQAAKVANAMEFFINKDMDEMIDDDTGNLIYLWEK